MRFLTVSLFFLFLSSVVSYAQDFDEYQLLKCKGEIPLEFITLSSAKVAAQSEIENLEESKAKERESKENFLLQSNFTIDELLNSGRVLFNDEVTQYINRIADYLLRDEPELRAELRFYTVKSSAVNAFATNNGIVFVNLGLLAQIENEAQLAFILSHEIQHYIRQHPINKYVQTQKIKKGTGIYRKFSFDELLLAKSQYSRDQESEADLLGLELYKTTDYSYASIDGVFDVLLYSYLPFNDVNFDYSFLETEDLVLPKAYLLEEVAEITAKDDYDDEQSSHPNISKRRSMIELNVKDLSDEGREDFLIDKDRFLEIRKMARFEQSHLFLLRRSFEEAIYNSYLLMGEESDSKYLKKSIVKSLYGLAKYKNEGKLFDVHRDFEEIEGHAQRLYYLIEQMEAQELNTMALVHAWRVLEYYPDDIELQMIVSDLMQEMSFYHAEYAANLSKTPAPVPDLTEPEDTLNDQESSKYDKIRKRNEEEFDPFKYACVSLFQSDEFVQKFEHALAHPRKDKRLDSSELSYRERLRAYRKFRKHGERLGAEKVVFMEPMYQKVDQRKDIPVRYIAAEEGQKRMNSMMQKNADLVGLEYELLDVHSLGRDEIERFNDMALLNNWIMERISHDDINEMVPLDYESVRLLVEKYGTKHFAWTGTMSVKDNRPSRLSMGLLGCTTIVLAPYAIYYLATPEIYTYYFTMVYDLENGKSEMSDFNILKAKPRYDYMQSTIYNTMLQIKGKKIEK